MLDGIGRYIVLGQNRLDAVQRRLYRRPDGPFLDVGQHDLVPRAQAVGKLFQLRIVGEREKEVRAVLSENI